MAVVYTRVIVVILYQYILLSWGSLLTNFARILDELPLLLTEAQKEIQVAIDDEGFSLIIEYSDTID